MVDKSTKAAKAAGRVLLPDYAKPERYNLKVTPDLVAYTFDGLVSIDMTTSDSFSEEESKKITLHAKELMFRSAKFQTQDGKIVSADEVSDGWFISRLSLVVLQLAHALRFLRSRSVLTSRRRLSPLFSPNLSPHPAASPWSLTLSEVSTIKWLDSTALITRMSMATTKS
jgi:hypothetical protein